MPQNVKLVEEDSRLRCVRLRGLAKRLPHVHHRQPYLFSGLQALKMQKTCPCPSRCAPRRRTRWRGADQVADHDPVGVPLPDRDFVDTDHLRPRWPRKAQLLAHVQLVQLLDGVPIQMHPSRHVRNRHRAAQPTDLPREAQRVFRTSQKEKRVSRSSRHRPCSSPAASENRDRPPGRHSQGRVPAASVCRIGSGKASRNRRTPFFCAPIQRQYKRWRLKIVIAVDPRLHPKPFDLVGIAKRRGGENVRCLFHARKRVTFSHP